MTPRELALCAEGYRWRERRQLEGRAWMIAYLLKPWGFKGEPKDLLPPEPGDASQFEQLAGITDPGESFDAMVKKQAERKAALSS